MTNSRHPERRPARRSGGAKTAGGKIKLLGLPIDIPAELDLPAGAPFEGHTLPATMRAPKEVQELFAPLVELATNAWRLKVRMVDTKTGEPKEDTAKLYRFVEGLYRALDNAGIQVIDKSGKSYDAGMPEKVVSFEKTPGLLKEEIIDTVRPTVRWKEQTLYTGEIIVGIPVAETPQASEPPAEAEALPAAPALETRQVANATLPTVQTGSPANGPQVDSVSGDQPAAIPSSSISPVQTTVLPQPGGSSPACADASHETTPPQSAEKTRSPEKE